MKTGRLLKFNRPGGQVHAYLYLDGGRYRAALYLMSSSQQRDGEPLHSIASDSDAAVETAARAWVDEHFPKTPRS